MTDIHQVWINGEAQLTPHHRAARAYNRKFPDRPPLSYGGKNPMVTGAWMIGACYKNPNSLYGAYPYGYLERVHAMFPDARKILHVFSGGLTVSTAVEAAWPDRWADVKDRVNLGLTIPGYWIELVDLFGPENGRYPTWQGSVHNLPREWEGRFDLILADPPYSTEDAEKYGLPSAPNTRKVMQQLRRVACHGANLVWLDTKWPMHRKTDWKTWGTIGLVRSTNHRVRLVSMFEAV